MFVELADLQYRNNTKTIWQITSLRPRRLLNGPQLGTPARNGIFAGLMPRNISIVTLFKIALVRGSNRRRCDCHLAFLWSLLEGKSSGDLIKWNELSPAAQVYCFNWLWKGF